jgi:hypothetical protein
LNKVEEIMKKTVDIDKERMEFLPHFGTDSKNGWIRIDIEALKLNDASYLFINLDDIEELTRIPLSEITSDIRAKWDGDRSQIPEIDEEIEDVEYVDIGRVRLPSKKKK